MKVNMTPNPLDVVTIHASQGDTEARQWEFELHNNGELIDTSDVKEQMFFKAYKGGTEQLLPENTSTPTTSPFLGDIKYPQGLLTDQEFLYRESPTEEDGMAWIKSIKGNTVKFNQLLQSLAPTTTRSGVTFTKNNDGTWTLNGTATANIDFRFGQTNATYYANHKYLLKVNKVNGVHLNIMQQTTWAEPLSTSRNIDAYDIQTLNQTYENMFAYFDVATGTSFNNVVLRPQLFDLTEMGIDNLTTLAQVESWLSDNIGLLPYYSYNQGSLLSFNGNGIKTVGFNQWDEEIEQGGLNATTGATASDSIRSRSVNFIPVLPNTQYYCYNLGGSLQPYYYDAEKNFIGYDTANVTNETFNTPSNCHFIKFRVRTDSIPFEKGNICINISSNKNGTYEPYTSSSLSLPISTYFPTGMKSAGSVYDELTPRKAITRIGAVDLGSLDWTLSTPSSHIFRGKLLGMNVKIPNASDLPNALLANYEPEAYNPISANDNGHFALGYRRYDDADVIVIIDSNYSTQDSFISYISGQYLYYELATPTETSFTTASLVTENAEIPLSNNDGTLIGKCTEQLSAEPGFHDAKIKLSDSDGTCYSNKLQLHVERSPQ